MVRPTFYYIAVEKKWLEENVLILRGYQGCGIRFHGLKMTFPMMPKFGII